MTLQNIDMPKKSKKARTAPAHGAHKRNGAEQPFAMGGADLHAATVASLKELRKVTQHTQDDIAIAMGVGQGTVSRIEKRDDMLVSTLQHYVEGVGGTLQILATFPDRPPLVVERLGKNASPPSKASNKKTAGPNSQAVP